RWPALAFAVADLWAEWPVHDAVADLVISIFAPKNFTETARVLRPGGWLAVVYPGPNHLIELSNRFGLMRQHQRKTQCSFEARSGGAADVGALLGDARLFETDPRESCDTFTDHVLRRQREAKA